MHSIRKFVGRGTIALTLATLVALAVAVQSGQAARGTSAGMRSSAVASMQLNADAHADLARQEAAESAPSPACVAAVNAVKSALASDRSEDNLETANAAPDTETGAEQTEDTNEAAALKPLFAAVATACGPLVGEKERETVRPSTPPTPPTAQCTAAIQALKAAFAQQRAQAMAEFTSGTEGTAADMSEDQAAKAQIVSLFSAVKAACGTSSFDWDHR